ncbi:MAG: hypothetical protein FWD69_13025 [Polyangiaceae bacterium]|nr:hypothetical protein [Polyangiaceae bacterium]
MKHPILSGACAAGVALATSLCASEATAANPQCSATGLTGTPVYLAGSSAAKPILKQLSAVLAKVANPVRIIYQSVSSCTGLMDITVPQADPTAGIYWDDNGNELTCDVASGGVVPDIGISDVYASTCDNVTIPVGQANFQGPVQIMTFVVPSLSKENTISAEAARIVYGFGATDSGKVVSPWNTNGLIFQRPTTSGTRRMIGKAIGLDVGKWKGTELNGSGDVLTAVQGASATNPDAAIGILAADLADTSRTTVKILAFQPQDQSCAYYPDSTSQSLDKANVRSGVYPIWGPVHLVTKVDIATGQPSDPNVKTVIDYLTMSSTINADAKKNMIDTVVAAHTIPWCAMNVTRNGEVSVNDQTTAYSDLEPCGCYYEFKATGAASSSCKTCAADIDCGGGTNKCRYGYCEAR